MDKFFDIIKKLRPGVQSGKVSREKALAELMQETGVSEDIAETAIKNMTGAQPEVPGGITSLKPDVTFTSTQKKLPEPIDMTVEERTSGLIKDQESGAKEKTSWKDYVEEESPSQGSGFANIDPDILSLGQKDRFEYEMAKYKQERSRKMQPIYKKYGALSEKDKELIDELYEYNLEGEFVPTKGNPKYINNSARTFIQESVEDIPGVDEDLVLDILYSKESERFLKNQGVDNYINYVQTKFKEIGLNFNKPLLKRFLKDRYGPEEFSVGGRVGFKDGVGRKGILSALKNKLNEIAPGSTAVGKTTKAISDKAKRAAAERELTQDFNRFNKKFPSEEVRKEREILDVPPVPEGFSTSKETLLKQFPELDEEFVETMMQMDKDLLGRTIMMLKDRRKDPELYDKLLEKYGDTLKFQGEFDKATRRKLNAEGGLNYLMGL
jgi:hypothetical protein